MKIPDLEFGPEWALLELLCLGLTTPDEQRAFEELLQSDDLYWGELLEQALLHKMMPLLSFHVMSSACVESVPRRMQDHLRSVLDLNRHKRSIWYAEADRVIKALGERNVQVLGRKDLAFESTLYGGNGSRRLGDLDLLIAPQDRETVIDALPQLGYQMGLYDWNTNATIPLPRKQLMILRLNPDHVPVHTLLTGDPVMQWLEVDFANSLTWTRSPYDVPIEAAMAEIVYRPVTGLPEIEIPCLTPPFQFISTTLHLFREAWFERWLDWEQDVDLTKFSDVLRLWNAHQDVLATKEFVQTIEGFGIVDPIVWVLEHLDRTLHTGIVSALGLEGRVTESWLSSGSASGKQLHQWTGTMRQRLQCKDRRKLFVDTSGEEQS